MPLTPFHLGPALLLAVLLHAYLDVPVLLLASVLPDLEALYLLLSGAGDLHGFFHSFLGAGILAAALALVWIWLGEKISGFFSFLGVDYEVDGEKVVLSSFAGTFSHILLDSFLYRDISPFFPLGENPLLGFFSHDQVVFFCVACFGLAAFAFMLGSRK